MIQARTLLGALVLAGLACGEPERNDPAPPSLSAGSVTIGGGGASTATTAAASDDSTGSDSGTTTVSTSMPTTTASTGDTLSSATGLDTGDPSMPDPPTAGGTAGAVGCEVAGEACEGDGICVAEVVPGGLQITCSHGNPGEPCTLDSHCVSEMCLMEVTARGSVTTCT